VFALPAEESLSMPQTATVHRRVALTSRPHGAPTAEHFRRERGDVAKPGSGQVLLSTLYLSPDPYLRGGMNSGPFYAAPAGVDDDGPRWNEFAAAMGAGVMDGQVKVREDMVFGVPNAPEAFIGPLQGRNFGTLVLQRADE
jgi:NADPH-dependent curcumin reductase CurA